ncbi:LuxR C-terminal-related transcriptional regulator [Umezawaea tangerina]|uniref:AAA ATPase-like protein n=1 Tax=Umezawaea tangerina TaxID=84725 RepID=A0A2T0SS32_9PSEU|nr:helix-turn-helix transcriptional regulator [Umezawaea tangerina]PRY36214.1 AAA ATPase-like protein [Umezawaea tangerina]
MTSPVPAWVVHRPVLVPAAQSACLGREVELRTMRTMLAKAAAGRSAIVTMTGELGVGKSVLLEATAELARTMGFAVAVGHGARLETHLDGGVIRQLADDLDGEGVDLRPDRVSSLEAFYRLVRQAADQRPVLIIIDDIHVTDIWSMRSMAYIRRRITDQPVLILLGSTTGHPPAREVSLQELTGCSAETVVLGGLDIHGVTELLRANISAPVHADLAAACLEVTCGNAYLLQSMFGALRLHFGDEIGAVTPAEVRELASADIGEQLRVRLRPLPGCAELVRAVAVLGDEATVDMVAAMSGVDYAQALRGIDALVRLRILCNSHTVSFQHPFVRNSVLGDLPVATRAADHARAARLLADAGSSDVEVAGHLLEARGIRIPWGLEVLRRAARDAAHHRRLELARDLLERALDEPLTPDQRLAVQLELVHAEFLGDSVKGMARLREALAHADDVRSAVGQAVTMLLRSCTAHEARLALSIGLQVQSRLSSQEKDEFWELRAMCYLAAAGNDLGLALRASLFTDDLESEQPDDPRLRQLHAVIMSLGHALRGDSALEAVKWADQALAGERTDVFVQPFVFTLSTCFLVDAPELSDKFRRMIGSTEEPHDFHLRKGTVVSLAHGMDFLASGELIRAKTFLKWQMRLFEELDAVRDCPMAILCAARLTEVLVDLGRADEARDLLARSGFAGELPELFQHNLVLYSRGKLKLALDDPSGALADLLECGRRLEASAVDSPAVIPWRALAVRAYLAQGQREPAAALAKEDHEMARQWGTPRSLGTALLSVGLSADDEDAATRALLKATEFLSESTAKLTLAEAFFELGAQLRRRGQPDRAIPHLRRAVELSAKCESQPLIRLAGDELRACEPVTAEGTVHGLTKQETRVAGMAAQGLTNRQIAEALFLTRRTVELHLSGAYRKLGITGRTDLAEALSQHRGQE